MGSASGRNKTVKPGSPVIVLASTSPRRQELLRILGLPFEVQAVDVDERQLPGEAPVRSAERLAAIKAELASSMRTRGIVVGADTIVVDGGTVLGKPRDPDEARAMLIRLRARSHEVITGLAAIDAATGRRWVGSAVTRVHMRAYSDSEIERYVASGPTAVGPLDKAGAYGIQDRPFRPVERIEGCYLNVVGLPLCQLARGLSELGVATPKVLSLARKCVCSRYAVRKLEEGRKGG